MPLLLKAQNEYVIESNVSVCEINRQREREREEYSDNENKTPIN